MSSEDRCSESHSARSVSPLSLGQPAHLTSQWIQAPCFQIIISLGAFLQILFLSLNFFFFSVLFSVQCHCLFIQLVVDNFSLWNSLSCFHIRFPNCFMGKEYSLGPLFYYLYFIREKYKYGTERTPLGIKSRWTYDGPENIFIPEKQRNVSLLQICGNLPLGWASMAKHRNQDSRSLQIISKNAPKRELFLPYLL